MGSIAAFYEVKHLEVEEFVTYVGTFTLSQEEPFKFSLSFELMIMFKHDGGAPLYTKLFLKDGTCWTDIIGDPTDTKEGAYETIEWEVLKLVFKLYYSAMVPPTHAIGKKRFGRKGLRCDDWIANAIFKEFEVE